MKAGKVWGETQSIFAANNVEVHRIAVKSGGFCSKHKHAHKWNLFFIESGKLQVEIWSPRSGLCDVAVLPAGETMAVPPGQLHRFTALTDVTAYEIYWVEIDPSDIDREIYGGVKAA